MKSSINWQNYQEQKAKSYQSLQQKGRQQIVTQLNHLWQFVLMHLTASSEPHVWTTRDQAGRTQWNAYDPITNREASYSSEAELRVWLEERHYQAS